MNKKKLEYINEWRRKNKDKVKLYNKKTMENKIQKAIEEYKNENNENISSL